jgi:hypothetical protein
MKLVHKIYDQFGLVYAYPININYKSLAHLKKLHFHSVFRPDFTMDSPLGPIGLAVTVRMINLPKRKQIN